MAERPVTSRPAPPPASKLSPFKLVLLGDSAVGKSSLLVRFVRDQFQDFQESTIGAAFVTQLVLVDGVTVKFEIWDTAGQERYHSLAPMYYRAAHAAVVVYDITSAETFDRAKRWVNELQEQANPNTVIALAGNKADQSANRAVEYEEAQVYAADNKLLFMETSAKTAMNISNLFLAIAKTLPRTEAQGGAGGRGARGEGGGGGGVDLCQHPQTSQAKCCGLTRLD